MFTPPHHRIHCRSSGQRGGGSSGVSAEGVETIDDGNCATRVPKDHDVRLSTRSRGRQRAPLDPVTPAVPFGVTSMKRIGTAVLFRMNWVQRNRESPTVPTAVAVLSELSIWMFPSMLQSVSTTVQVCGCAMLGPMLITVGEVVTPVGVGSKCPCGRLRWSRT